MMDMQEQSALYAAAKIGARWMQWWLQNEECECEIGHTCGKPKRQRELDFMLSALKLTPEELAEPNPLEEFADNNPEWIKRWLACEAAAKAGDPRPLMELQRECGVGPLVPAPEVVQPSPPQIGPYRCTKEKPWNASKGEHSIHPDAVEVDSACDCCARYRCPNCGMTCKVELPQ